MFVEFIVLCREDKEELKVFLEKWKKVFEDRGLTLSSRMRQYLQAGGIEQGTVYNQGETVKKVDHLRNLHTIVHANGCSEEVARRR